MIICKSKAEIEKMRQAGLIVAEALKLVEKRVKKGMTTQDLNQIIENFLKEKKAKPAFKGYKGYPAASCISVGAEVVHGIPGPKQLKEGDIVSVDIGVEYNGYYADAAATYGVGQLDEGAKRLIEITKKSLEAGIKKAKVGNYLRDISLAIQQVAEKAGYSVVRDFVGHGIGRSMHEEPQVPNYVDGKLGPKLKAGMVLALEPMVNEGTYEVEVLDDGWTVVTADKKLSAHFEHTVAITENGADILTLV